MPLNEQDKIQYLANVLKVAFDNKSLSARETAALEEIRKSIDAKKGLLAAAQKIVEIGSYNFIKAGSFADQVKNGLETADWLTRRQILRTLIKQVKVNREEIRVAYRVSPPFC